MRFSGIRSRLDIESAPVVTDSKPVDGVAMHREADKRGTGMLAHIRQRFLQNMQHLQLVFGMQRYARTGIGKFRR